MHRRYALYLGDALLVLGGISVLVAVNRGVFGGTTLAGCMTPGKPPYPSVEFIGLPPQARVYGLYDGCNYTKVAGEFTYGILTGLIGIAVLAGERITRRRRTVQ